MAFFAAFGELDAAEMDMQVLGHCRTKHFTDPVKHRRVFGFCGVTAASHRVQVGKVDQWHDLRRQLAKLQHFLQCPQLIGLAMSFSRQFDFGQSQPGRFL